MLADRERPAAARARPGAVRPTPERAAQLAATTTATGHCACGGGCPRCATGQALPAATRSYFEPRLGADFSSVRVHAGDAAAQRAQALGADAYTQGDELHFARGAFAPHTEAGRELLAHELAHVVQQRNGAGSNGRPGDPAALERQAERAAGTALRGGRAAVLGSAAPSTVQRSVAMLDVGRREHSGFARVQELIDRLNAMPGGIIYELDGRLLGYTVVNAPAINGFDRQMQAFIDDEAREIPLRFTNRHGMERHPLTGEFIPVDVDSFQSGYVDIDDLLASSALGLQTALVHVLRERAQVSNYARRLGTTGLSPLTVDADGNAQLTQEFRRTHASGINAELQVLRDFFGDPAIRAINLDARVFRNSRNDTIRERDTRGRGAEGAGVLAISWEVVLHENGRVMTPDDYLQFMEAERTRAQVNSERLNGATEHRSGGHNVPAA